MRCTEILKARVTLQIKHQVRAIAERDFLPEAAWLKRLVIREVRARDVSQMQATIRRGRNGHEEMTGFSFHIFEHVELIQVHWSCALAISAGA